MSRPHARLPAAPGRPHPPLRTGRRWSLLAVGLVGALAACEAGSLPGDDPPLGPDDPRTCGAGVVAVPHEGAQHIPEDQRGAWQHNPPASGQHWPVWQMPWGEYLDTVVPRERWLHNAEHGGIILLFNCGTPDGGSAHGADGGLADAGPTRPCPSVTDAFAALRAERRPDRFGIVRILVTSDPLLPRRAAAVAWHWVWSGDTVDVPAVRCFIDKRYARGPEDAP